MQQYIDSGILSNYFLDKIDELALVEESYLCYEANKLLNSKRLENTDTLINIL